MSDETPIDMVLHCPNCHEQHIDGPEPYSETTGWINPPHRSHLCHKCGHIWRPADVPTNGIAAVRTRGKNDSPEPSFDTGSENEAKQALDTARATIEMLIAERDDARNERDALRRDPSIFVGLILQHMRQSTVSLYGTLSECKAARDALQRLKDDVECASRSAT